MVEVYRVIVLLQLYIYCLHLGSTSDTCGGTTSEFLPHGTTHVLNLTDPTKTFAFISISPAYKDRIFGNNGLIDKIFFTIDGTIIAYMDSGAYQLAITALGLAPDNASLTMDYEGFVYHRQTSSTTDLSLVNKLVDNEDRGCNYKAQSADVLTYLCVGRKDSGFYNSYQVIYTFGTRKTVGPGIRLTTDASIVIVIYGDLNYKMDTILVPPQPTSYMSHVIDTFTVYRYLIGIAPKVSRVYDVTHDEIFHNLVKAPEISCTIHTGRCKDVGPCDSQHISERVACNGRNKASCERAGCCWDRFYSPKCFTKDYTGISYLTWSERRQVCGVRPADRVDCGWPKITKFACLCRGCCWSSQWKVIQCYYPK